MDPALFRAIDDNVRFGTFSFTQETLRAKEHVSKGRSLQADATTRTALLLLAAQYEARLNWLIWHPDSKLTLDQRSNCLVGGTTDRWRKLLKEGISYRLAALDPPIVVAASSIPRDLPKKYRSYYFDLIRMAERFLGPLIDTRNSLAHGEWRTALARRPDAINHDRTRKLSAVSLFEVTVLANLLDHFWKAHFDALVTYYAFERDFTVHRRRMVHAAVRLERGDAARWTANLRKRFVDGRSAHGGLSQPPVPWAVYDETVPRELRP